MKMTLLIIIALLLLRAPKKSDPVWEYQTLTVFDDVTRKHEGSYEDAHGSFARMDLSEEMKNTLVNEHWELCASFLEPRNNPRLVLIFKRRLSD